MLERDMEELIARYPEEFFPRKAWRLKDRQKSFAGVGRFDLLFEDEHRTNVLIELKARPAKYEDADQLAKYKTAVHETDAGNVIMWLVSPLIPKPVRDFLDSIGIDYTEIHEAEFRAIASKHSFTIQSETRSSPSHSSISGWNGVALPPNSSLPPITNVAASHGFANPIASGSEYDFLSRCDADAKHFFSRLFACQKTLTNRTQITWNHESGFSLQVRFHRLGFVELLWGFPAVNREGARSRNHQSLVLPLDFAARRHVPHEFLNDFVLALAGGIRLGGGLKRPSIDVVRLSESETEHVLNTLTSFVLKAETI